MGEERPFEREVLDRLAVIETKLDPIVINCRDCQKNLNIHSVELATIAASTKSAHHRIDGVYKAAGLISAGVGLLMSVLNFLFNNLPKGGN